MLQEGPSIGKKFRDRTKVHLYIARTKGAISIIPVIDAATTNYRTATERRSDEGGEGKWDCYSRTYASIVAQSTNKNAYYLSSLGGSRS